MIVGDLFSNLGNQLFTYAATKSIALDLGYEYRYRVIKPGFAASNDCLDAYGHEYSKDFEQAFHIDTSERIGDVPDSINNSWKWERTADINFIKEAYKIPDNTRLEGYFLCPKYFEHRREQVLEWFRFKKEFLYSCTETRNKIIEKTETDHLVSIHLRCGKDYLQSRLVIDPEYHKDAIRLIKEKFNGEKLCFILFSDVPDEAKRMLKNEGEDIVLHHGTMFEDLCLMTLCDSHIIANSTFSWWGAWLANNDNRGVICRPSIWPIEAKKLGPEDIFPSSWISIDAKRQNLTVNDRRNRANDIFRSIMKLKIKQIRRLVKMILRKLLPDLLLKKGLDMNATYSGSTLEKCSDEELKTQILHLAHDLDKTINTLPGLPEFEETAEREIKNLMDSLGECSRRSFGMDETTDWANELISEAKSLLLNQNELKEENIDLNIDYNKAEELFELIKTRRSIRSWQGKKIPKAVIEKLLEAATWAPSACNRQSVRYIVLEDDEQKMSLVKLREKFLGRAPVLIFIGADSRNYYSEEVEIVPYLDAAVATQNLLLMAHAMGLGAVMVKCTNEDIKMDVAWSGGLERKKAVLEMYSKLNLPKHFLPAAIVALGYPKRVPKAPPRVSKDRVGFFGHFQENMNHSNPKKGALTVKHKLKLFIIKVIHRLAKYLGIRIYITLDE